MSINNRITDGIMSLVTFMHVSRVLDHVFCITCTVSRVLYHVCCITCAGSRVLYHVCCMLTIVSLIVYAHTHTCICTNMHMDTYERTHTY